MNIFANKRAANTAGLVFQLSPVATGCAIFVTALAGSAHAQTAVTEPTAEAPMQTVQVTGIRRAIEDAITVKRDATGIWRACRACRPSA